MIDEQFEFFIVLTKLEFFGWRSMVTYASSLVSKLEITKDFVSQRVFAFTVPPFAQRCGIGD